MLAANVKGTVSRDFLVLLVFFHQKAPPGPIKDVHGQFYIFLLFHRVIALSKQLPGTLETEELLTHLFGSNKFSMLG